MIDPAWLADLARYPAPRPFLKEQSLWAVWTYRYGRRQLLRKPGWSRKIHLAVYRIGFKLTETMLGISLPLTVRIGPGLRIWHFGGIFVHADAVIGRNCTLRQGVTLGNRHAGGGAPILGDNVELGAYAQVLGPVRLGDNCRIGALAVVLCDVPAGATAVGAPARIIPMARTMPGR